VKGKFLIVVTFLCISIPNALPQHVLKDFNFTCTVNDALSNRPVAFCHIFNESRRHGFIADSLGKSHSIVYPGDTLVFIALGYLGKTYIIQLDDTIPTKIRLTPRTYEIEAVTIGIPRTYSELKEAILAVDVDKGKPMSELPEYNPYIRPQLLDTNVLNKAGFMIMHPVSGLYYRFNKEEKSKRMVRYMQEQELKQSTVDAKYSREFVTELTGLTGTDLNNFIGYCNFSFNYLYEATPLEIVEAIYSRYDEFKKCCIGNKNDKNTEPE